MLNWLRMNKHKGIIYIEWAKHPKDSAEQCIIGEAYHWRSGIKLTNWRSVIHIPSTDRFCHKSSGLISPYVISWRCTVVCVRWGHGNIVRQPFAIFWRRISFWFFHMFHRLFCMQIYRSRHWRLVMKWGCGRMQIKCRPIWICVCVINSSGLLSESHTFLEQNNTFAFSEDVYV